MDFRRTFFILVIGQLALGLAVRVADGGSLVEALPLGSVDWAVGRVLAFGQSVPSKKDFGKTADPQVVLAAARAAADRNLLETLKAVRLDARRSVGQAVGAQAAVMEKLRTMIGALEADKKAYLSDGTVRITLGMDLTGAFSQLVLPPEIQQVEPIRAVTAAAGKADQTTDGGREVFTGMVVDARGLPLHPAMVVHLEDEEGRPVFGPAFVSREHAVQSGMCGFHTDPAAAQKDRRVGPRPLVAKGLRVSEATAALVISNADAAKLRSASEHLAFLRRCAVVMVLE